MTAEINKGETLKGTDTESSTTSLYVKRTACWIKISADAMPKYFLILSRKQDLTFLANCHLGDNLHEMSSYFLEKKKKKKKIISLSSAEIVQRKVRKP